MAEIGAVASPIHQLFKFKHQGEVIIIRATRWTDTGIDWELAPPEPGEGRPSPESYDEELPDGWSDYNHWYEEGSDSQMFQDLIQEDWSPVYDEYEDLDWYEVEATLNSFCQNLQAARIVISPPPKPPDPAKGSRYAKGIYEHISGQAPSLMESSWGSQVTRGTLQEMGQDEFDSDTEKAKIGCKSKEKREDAPHYSTPGADFRSHPSGKSPHLGRGVRNSTEPD